MDRLFLDACVLFSAAYNQTSPLRRLWELPDTAPLSSGYAVAEAERNIAALRPERLDDLGLLTKRLTIVGAARIPLPEQAASLPEKDAPILLAAMNARATHLLTVDKKHFGPLCGQTIGGVLILTPGEYLHRKQARTEELRRQILVGAGQLDQGASRPLDKGVVAQVKKAGRRRGGK